MLLSMLLSATAAAQFARWDIVDRREDFIVYADTATIRKQSQIARMWDLSDGKPGKMLPGVKKSQSFRSEREYDCAKQQLRVLYISWHAGSMGEGQILGSTSKTGAWQPALHGTIGEKLWQIACGVDSGKRF